MPEKGEAYIVSTPIGNLKDITIRAIETLKRVDLIVCEDKRVTIKILNNYGIKKPLVSFHSKSRESTLKEIVRRVMEGHNIAIVTDRGTPLISDPGGKLVEGLLNEEVKVIPIPGPSAVQTSLAASGFSFSDYAFFGFISSKGSRRRKKLEELKKNKGILVFYEAPHRIINFLEDARDIFGNIKGCVCKEMTKKFEKYYRGRVGDITDRIKKDSVKGEYTIVLDNR